MAGLFSPKLVPTAPPENLTVVVLDSRSLRLSWTPLPAEHQNGEVLGYSITLVAVETGTAPQHNSSSTSLTISELHPYYTYQCRVAAFNSAGMGPFTAVVEKMTDQDGMYMFQVFSGNVYALGDQNNLSYSFFFQFLLATHKMVVPQ